MTTGKTLLFIVMATVLGVAAMAWFNGPAEDPSPAAGPAANGRHPAVSDPEAPIKARLEALEEALGVERQARQLLQEELAFVTAELDRLSSSDAPSADQSSPVDLPAAASDTPTRRNSRRSRNDPEVRIEQMIAAGFSQLEAEQILRRESELRMEALQARYDARRSGESVSFFTAADTRNALREELGDSGYERYLAANGRPTSVTVSTVLEGSPALAAGLRPGDKIVNYDGRRVFSMDEITRLTMEGEARQNVMLGIERDGVLMQLSMPRGPLGVTGGRRFRR